MEKKNIETSALAKLSGCIKKIYEKGVYLKDEDLLQVTGDLIQIKEEMEKDLTSALALVKDIQSVVHNTKAEPNGGIITSNNIDDLDRGFDGVHMGR